MKVTNNTTVWQIHLVLILKEACVSVILVSICGWRPSRNNYLSCMRNFN